MGYLKTSCNKNNLAVVIFRSNLRTFDNPALIDACSNFDTIVSLYSLEILQGYNEGFEKCGKYRKEFIYQTLTVLQQKLDSKNISLFIVADIVKALQQLSKEYAITLFYEKEVGVEEKIFENTLNCYPHKTFLNQTMLDFFKFDYTKSFSHFKQKAQKLSIDNPQKDIKYQSKNQREFEIETMSLELNGIDILFLGGEDEAIKRVDYYFENHLHSYLDTRALIDGKDISTALSPYLSVGAISAKSVYKKLKSYEDKTYKSKSSYWIFFELLWRDFFYMVMAQSDNKLFLKTEIQNTKYDFKRDSILLDSFFDAKTGVDIIDAGVIELKKTGWLSNRQRQLLASYFCKNLGLDFRIGAAFFQQYLIDYNPASNYGNWAYQAGVGNDKSYRVFDPVKQSAQYNGKPYIKKWLHKNETRPQVDYQLLAQKVKNEVYENNKVL